MYRKPTSAVGECFDLSPFSVQTDVLGVARPSFMKTTL